MPDPPEHGRPAWPYALAQLARAIRAEAGGVSGGAERVRKWRDVLRGMAVGTLRPGERTPVRGMPAWATPEVAHGGFATGRARAGGAVTPAELRAAARLGLAPAPLGTLRERLNLHFLEHAAALLVPRLAAGAYYVGVAEEAALPAVALLGEQGRHDAAAALLREIAPWFDRLRFFPDVEAAPPPAGGVTSVRNVGQAVRRLRARRTPTDLARQLDAVLTWTPLYERLLALWHETLVTASGGERRVEFAHLSPAWRERRSGWLDDYASLRARGVPHGRYGHRKSNFRLLATALSAHAPEQLPTSERARVRHALASSERRWGAIGSQVRAARLAEREREVAEPLHTTIAGLVADRLAALPPYRGLADPAAYLTPVKAARPTGGVAEVPVPRAVYDAVDRAREATVEQLLARHYIPSLEVLATCTAPLVAEALRESTTDASVGELYRQTYLAFARRRSLLLFNYASQVRLAELPWVTALDVDDASQAQRAVAARLVRLAWRAFPERALPNPFLRRIAQLCHREGEAERDPPIVYEIAADIFMGGFTPAWVASATTAHALLADRFYGRYYSFLPEAPADPEAFAKTAHARTAEQRTNPGGAASPIAANGAVVEQARVLCSDNLAALAAAFGLAEAALPSLAEAAAERALGWTFGALARADALDYAGARSAVARSAEHLRQAAFFLSFVPAQRTIGLVDALPEATAAQIAARAGLRHVARGGSMPAHGRLPGGGRRLLRWSVGRHWALGSTDFA